MIKLLLALGVTNLVVTILLWFWMIGIYNELTGPGRWPDDKR